MASQVAICNMALASIGKPDINDIDEASAEAMACKRFFEQVRDSLLAVYPYSFARKTALLAPVGNDRPQQWLGAFKRPNDCIKIVRLLQQRDVATTGPDRIAEHDPGLPHEIEGDVIYCDAEIAWLDYSWRVADPNKFPPLFVTAFAAALAVNIVMPLTRDPQLRAQMQAEARPAQLAAEMADAGENRATGDFPSELIEARH